jgi:hypothetical protein
MVGNVGEKGMFVVRRPACSLPTRILKRFKGVLNLGHPTNWSLGSQNQGRIKLGCSVRHLAMCEMSGETWHNM